MTTTQQPAPDMLPGPEDERDPMDDPEYQKWIAEVAKRCQSKYAPCGGCQAGGICDNFDGIEDQEDEGDSYDDLSDMDDEP